MIVPDHAAPGEALPAISSADGRIPDGQVVAALTDAGTVVPARGEYTRAECLGGGHGLGSEGEEAPVSGHERHADRRLLAAHRPQPVQNVGPMGLRTIGAGPRGGSDPALRVAASGSGVSAFRVMAASVPEALLNLR